MHFVSWVVKSELGTDKNTVKFQSFGHSYGIDNGSLYKESVLILSSGHDKLMS